MARACGGGFRHTWRLQPRLLSEDSMVTLGLSLLRTMRLRIRASPKGGHPARLHPPPHSPQTRAPPAHPPESPAASCLSGWSAGPLPRAPLLPGMPPQGRPPLGARKAGRAPPAALSAAGEVGGGRLERGGDRSGGGLSSGATSCFLVRCQAHARTTRTRMPTGHPCPCLRAQAHIHAAMHTLAHPRSSTHQGTQLLQLHVLRSQGRHCRHRACINQSGTHKARHPCPCGRHVPTRLRQVLLLLLLLLLLQGGVHMWRGASVHMKGAAGGGVAACRCCLHDAGSWGEHGCNGLGAACSSVRGEGCAVRQHGAAACCSHGSSSHRS